VPLPSWSALLRRRAVVPQEETLDAPNEAAQPKVEATQLLADLPTLSYVGAIEVFIDVV